MSLLIFLLLYFTAAAPFCIDVTHKHSHSLGAIKMHQRKYSNQSLYETKACTALIQKDNTSAAEPWIS